MTDRVIASIPVTATLVDGRAHLKFSFPPGISPDLVSDETRLILTKMVGPFVCHMQSPAGNGLWAIADFGTCSAEMQCQPEGVGGYAVLVHFCTPPPKLSDLGMLMAGGVNKKAGN